MFIRGPFDPLMYANPVQLNCKVVEIICYHLHLYLAIVLVQNFQNNENRKQDIPNEMGALGDMVSLKD